MDRRPQRWRQGDALSARKLNTTVDTVIAATRGVLGPQPGFPQAGRVHLLEIKTLNADTLLCTQPGETATVGAEEWIVDLPDVFTETTRGTTTYTYTDINTRQASDGGATEDQEITPSFITGEQILAVEIPDFDKLLFLSDGRMWAKV